MPYREPPPTVDEIVPADDGSGFPAQDHLRGVGRDLEKRKAFHRRQNYRRLYSLTVEEYEQMLRNQNGVCAICGTAPKKKRLHVDHNHYTGKVRALLCAGCNLIAGFLEHQKRAMVEEYLAKHTGEH